MSKKPSIAVFIATWRKKGMTIRLEGGKLFVSAPFAHPEWLKIVAARRPEILAYLLGGEA